MDGDPPSNGDPHAPFTYESAEALLYPLEGVWEEITPSLKGGARQRFHLRAMHFASYIPSGPAEAPGRPTERGIGSWELLGPREGRRRPRGSQWGGSGQRVFPRVDSMSTNTL